MLYGYHIVQGSTNLQTAPTTVTQTVTTTRTPHQGHNVNRGILHNQGNAQRDTLQEQGYAPWNNAAPQQQEYATLNNTTPQRQEYLPRNHTTPQHQEVAPRTSATSQNREFFPRNNAATIRSIDGSNDRGFSMSQPYRGDPPSSPRTNTYDSSKLQDEDDAGLARQNSVPRKQVGTSISTPYSSVQASPPPMAQKGHSRQQSYPKPLPSTPSTASHGYNDRQADSSPQPSSILNRSRPISASQPGLRDPQDVVDRAKTNTYDTQVVETVAPGQSYL